jgi:hypothetical protein
MAGRRDLRLPRPPSEFQGFLLGVDGTPFGVLQLSPEGVHLSPKSVFRRVLEFLSTTAHRIVCVFLDEPGLADSRSFPVLRGFLELVGLRLEFRAHVLVGGSTEALGKQTLPLLKLVKFEAQTSVLFSQLVGMPAALGELELSSYLSRRRRPFTVLRVGHA